MIANFWFLPRHLLPRQEQPGAAVVGRAEEARG